MWSLVSVPQRLCLLLLLLAVPGVTYSHDARPVYVEVQESQPDSFTVRWKAPISMPPAGLPTLEMPKTCASVHESFSGRTSDAYIGHLGYFCPGGLAGSTLGLRYPAGNPGLSALFRLTYLSGEVRTYIVDPGGEGWTVPDSENILQVSKQYTWLGVSHIFAGIDHLLFVACLIFIARTPSRILVTVTGFTLAHSLTLVLSTLGLVQFPVAAVEAAIAWSIIFLAHEIAVPNQGSWTWRYPVSVSGSFGLLHGLGFAAVLGDIGLPQTELSAALLFFNLGVELGQIFFISAIALTAKLATWMFRVHRDQMLSQRVTALAGSYLIGTIASMWLIQRIADI